MLSHLNVANALGITAIPCQVNVQHFCQTMELRQEKTSHSQREEKGIRVQRPKKLTSEPMKCEEG